MIDNDDLTDLDDLSDSQLKELKSDLGNLEIELAAVIAGGKSEGRTVDLDLPIGRLTRMDAIQQKKMEEVGRRQAGIRMQQVKAAIRLVAADEYGFCRQCEDPIGFKRLKARPEAPFCLSCQNVSEKRQPR